MLPGLCRRVGDVVNTGGTVDNSGRGGGADKRELGPFARRRRGQRLPLSARLTSPCRDFLPARRRSYIRRGTAIRQHVASASAANGFALEHRETGVSGAPPAPPPPKGTHTLRVPAPAGLIGARAGRPPRRWNRFGARRMGAARRDGRIRYVPPPSSGGLSRTMAAPMRAAASGGTARARAGHLTVCARVACDRPPPAAGRRAPRSARATCACSARCPRRRACDTLQASPSGGPPCRPALPAARSDPHAPLPHPFAQASSAGCGSGRTS